VVIIVVVGWVVVVVVVGWAVVVEDDGPLTMANGVPRNCAAVILPPAPTVISM